MTSDPVPGTNFEAWGQGVYSVDANGVNLGGVNVLFAISDTRRRWLAWYIFRETGSIDNILIGKNHHVWGEQSARSSTFFTNKAITVDELTDQPLLYSRGRRSKGVVPVLASINMDQGTDAITVQYANISQSKEALGTSTINLYVKSLRKLRGVPRAARGYTDFIASEPFSYPNAHLNVRERIKNLERLLF